MQFTAFIDQSEMFNSSDKWDQWSQNDLFDKNEFIDQTYQWDKSTQSYKSN